MDYRSRQRVPSEQISINHNKEASKSMITPINSNKQIPTDAPSQQTSATSSTRTTSSSLGGAADLQQLDSLQSTSSSQQAILSNYLHTNPQQHQQQRFLGASNKMNQQQQQRNNLMQQQQQQQNNKQRLATNQQQQLAQQQQQQQNRLMAAATATSNRSTTSQLNNNNNNYGIIANNKNHTHNHNMKSHQSNAANSLLLHSSSGDNLTTSSGEQTIDDLQQLAHNYRNNPNNLHQHQNVNLHKYQQHHQQMAPAKMSSAMYTFGTNERRQQQHQQQDIGLNGLSPRLLANPSSSSTTTSSSLAATSSSVACIKTQRNPTITNTDDYQYHHDVTISGTQSGSRFLLGVLFTLAEILLFSVLLLWLYWAFQHDDGLSWQADRKQQFNTHAALMILGFIFLNGQAMLIYRSFQCCTKIYTKILHSLLFIMATCAIAFGLCLAYLAQENVGLNNKPIMHFYSLHAWIGLSSISLFALQFTFGFLTFLVMLCCEQATSNFRATLLPIHKTFGLIIFSLAISTCLTGLLQTARSRLR